MCLGTEEAASAMLLNASANNVILITDIQYASKKWILSLQEKLEQASSKGGLSLYKQVQCLCILSII